MYCFKNKYNDKKKLLIMAALKFGETSLMHFPEE